MASVDSIACSFPSHNFWGHRSHVCWEQITHRRNWVGAGFYSLPSAHSTPGLHGPTVFLLQDVLRFITLRPASSPCSVTVTQSLQQACPFPGAPDDVPLMGSSAILLYSYIHLAQPGPASEEQRINTVESMRGRLSESAAAPWSDPLPNVASSAGTTGPVFDIHDFMDREFQFPPSEVGGEFT